MRTAPWATLLLGVGVLGVLAWFGVGLHTGPVDAGTDRPSSSTRHAHDLLTLGFGPGSQGPVLIVATAPHPLEADAMSRLADVAGGDPEVAAVLPRQCSADRTTCLLTVVPRSAPQDDATSALVRRLREHLSAHETRVGEQVEPTAQGMSVDVGGLTATSDDLADLLDRGTWQFKGALLLVSAILLLVIFRSLTVPLKTAAQNLLSVQAALGVVALVFSGGLLADLLEVEPGPIAPYVPLIVFTMAFGVSIDYEIFLVSRIREEWLRRGNNAEAVTRGLTSSAGVITAAASIMAAVFAAYAVLDNDRLIKQLALGLFAAIVLDALVIRWLVLPSSMIMFGAKLNWRLPAVMDRWLPQLAIDGNVHAAKPSRQRAHGRTASTELGVRFAPLSPTRQRHLGPRDLSRAGLTNRLDRRGLPPMAAGATERDPSEGSTHDHQLRALAAHRLDRGQIARDARGQAPSDSFGYSPRPRKANAMSPTDELRRQATPAAKRDGRHGIPSHPDQPGLPAFINKCLSVMKQRTTSELYAYAKHVGSYWEAIGTAKTKIIDVDEQVDQTKTQLAELIAPAQPASRVDMFRYHQRLRPLDEQLKKPVPSRDAARNGWPFGQHKLAVRGCHPTA